MDNFHIDVTASGWDTLRDAVPLGFFQQSRATHYKLVDGSLILYWMPTCETLALTYVLTRDNAADFLWQWLQQQDYGSQPDHDGSNTKGWRLYNEAWGQVGSEYQAFLAVRPAWAMHGK